MVWNRRTFPFLLGIYFLVIPNVSATPLIPDTSAARRSMIDEVLAAIPSAPEESRRFLAIEGEIPVMYRTHVQNDRRYHIFIPAERDDMDLVAPGTWIVRRRIEDGEPEQIKIFLRADQGTFVRIRPRDSRSELDLYITGFPFYRAVPLGVPLDRVLELPFETIQSATEALIEWDLLLVDTENSGYRRVESIVSILRERLPSLPDAEDGAMDENGRLVFIEDLRSQERLPGFNCSGFAKWVVDGQYRPLTGSFLPIEPLKEKHLDLRGTIWTASYEEERDPFFGLDWTRNLARMMAAAEEQKPVDAVDPESRDVRHVGALRYVEDMGFRTEDLPELLYRLAREEPGTFYLGSVAREYGSDPILRQHSHVVVFFPWFDQQGVFRLSVMERNVETDLASILRRYPDDLVHLVRVRAEERFDPPLIESVDSLR